MAYRAFREEGWTFEVRKMKFINTNARILFMKSISHLHSFLFDFKCTISGEDTILWHLRGTTEVKLQHDLTPTLHLTLQGPTCPALLPCLSPQMIRWPDVIWSEAVTCLTAMFSWVCGGLIPPAYSELSPRVQKVKLPGAMLPPPLGTLPN